MGLFGFMEGETLTKGVADLPEADVQLSRTRSPRCSPASSTGSTCSPARSWTTPARSCCRRQKLEQSDLDQFPPGAPGSECKTCMYWWNEGITAELPALE